jgi:hypothetical protein
MRWKIPSPLSKLQTHPIGTEIEEKAEWFLSWAIQETSWRRRWEGWRCQKDYDEYEREKGIPSPNRSPSSESQQDKGWSQGVEIASLLELSGVVRVVLWPGLGSTRRPISKALLGHRTELWNQSAAQFTNVIFVDCTLWCSCTTVYLIIHFVGLLGHLSIMQQGRVGSGHGLDHQRCLDLSSFPASYEWYHPQKLFAFSQLQRHYLWTKEGTTAYFKEWLSPGKPQVSFEKL